MHPVRRSGRRRLLAYCAASLVPVLTIGLLVASIASNQLQRQGLAEARSGASLIDRTVSALIGPGQHIGLTPVQVTALTGELRQMMAEHRFYGLGVWSSDNTAILDTGGPFQPVPLHGAPLRSVRSGGVLTRPLDVPHSRASAVAVSELLATGTAGRGYLTVYIPFDTLHAELNAELDRIDLGLGLGLALLYVVLFLINRSTTRGLRREAELNSRLARTDVLTGLPNRRALHEHIEQLLAAGTGPPRRFSVVIVDLNQFKHVNDNLGHRIGDRLLQEVARRLSTSTRGEDFVSRLGGDEFALILSGTSDAQQVAGLIERVRSTLRTDMEHEGIPLSVEASFGVALHPQDGSDADLLLQRADTAMYRAKAAETSVRFYDKVVDVSKPEWLTLAGQLRRAVGAGELRLYYQPKISLDSRDLVGVEALLRWEHPERGLIAPDDFLGIAERTGAIRPITEWVLDEALAQMARWDHATRVPCLSVNISTKSLRYEDGLPDTVSTLLERHGISPGRLTLEVTETALAADDAVATDVVAALSRIGVQISIDDFGKGFTGIGYLKQMPVSELKVDKEFVMRMLNDKADHAIVQSVVDLARRLDLDCTAEGIESREIYEALRAIGCRRGQGFFISVPLGPDELARWARSNLGAARPTRAPERAPGALLGR